MSRFFIFIFIFLLSASKASAEQAIEVLAVEYPPFTTEKVSGNGISFRLLHQRLKGVTDFKIQPRFLPPARLQKRIQSGDWCLSFYPSYEDHASKFVSLADKVFRIGLYQKRDDPNLNWQELDQLQGYRVALLRSDRSSPLFDRFITAGMKPVFVDEVEQGLRMLQMGRVEAALGDEHMTSFVGLGYDNLSDITFAKTALFETQIGVFVNNSCPHAELLDSSE